MARANAMRTRGCGEDGCGVGGEAEGVQGGGRRRHS